MKKKLSFIIILALLSFGLVSACDQNTAESPDKSIAENVPKGMNKENQFKQMYYQKLSFNESTTSLERATEQIKKQSGIDGRSSHFVGELNKPKDTLMVFYADEAIYNVAMFATTKSQLEANDYNLEELMKKDNTTIDLMGLQSISELKTDGFLALPYLEKDADNLFLAWENNRGVKSYFALGNLKNASENLENIGVPDKEVTVQETLNKENAVGTTYYQSLSIMYDSENIDSHTSILEEEAGVQNRTAVINTEIADGNAILAIYGEDTIFDLALYAMNQEDFEKVDYDAKVYAEKYLTSANKVSVAAILTPKEYAMIRCDETEGIPAYMIAWKDSNNQTQSFVVAYDGKGKE